MKRYLRDRPGVVTAVIVLAVAGAIFVVVWFQPQKLLIERTVNESLPRAPGPASASTSGVEETTSVASPRVIAAGTFQGLEHDTKGSAEIIDLGDGRRFLRFEDLETSNGPDLRVYLSEIEASNDWYVYGERFIDLGGLKGNLGDQNYEIPERIDLSRYKSAVIWCRRFTVGFGVAGLS